VSAHTIRDAELRDLPALQRVFREASLSNAGDRAALLAHPDVLELSDAAVREGRTRVATVGDEVVGFATLAHVDASLELEDLFVAPDRMRQGVGRALIRDVVRVAQERGVARVDVTANLHARAFYEDVGFRTVGDADTPFGPALRMQLDVGP
jgi:GNAT superfamily N-acetyltransferase